MAMDLGSEPGQTKVFARWNKADGGQRVNPVHSGVRGFATGLTEEKALGHNVKW